MTLNNYYRVSMFIPSGLVIACTLIYGIVQLIVNRDYKSEWLTNESAIFISFIMVILNSILMCCLSLPIFLNKYEKVKKKFVLNTLSWFLLPAIWIGSIWIKHISYLSHRQHGIDSESLFVIVNTFPYVIGLMYTFIRFQLNERLSS